MFTLSIIYGFAGYAYGFGNAKDYNSGGRGPLEKRGFFRSRKHFNNTKGKQRRSKCSFRWAVKNCTWNLDQHEIIFKNIKVEIMR